MSKETDINNPEHFYSTRQPKIQRGFYNLFVRKYKIPVTTLIECLEDFRKQRQPDIHHPWGTAGTLKEASFHFEDFLKLVSEKTGKTFGGKRPRNYEGGYDEWWQESNVDGAFAYNGVTEDF
jgi:hypothetical protein